MTKAKKELIQEEDLIEEMQEEIEEIEDLEGEQGEIDEEKLEDAKIGGTNYNHKELHNLLTRTQADFENFKKRTDRDREDMIFFLKSDIFKKILPRVDDLERIVKNTPKEMRDGPLFEGIVSLEKNLKKDLDNMGVKTFNSIGEEVDPHKHDVMTKAPGEENIIIDEFEKGYELNSRILRHAKVVVGAGE